MFLNATKIIEVNPALNSAHEVTDCTVGNGVYCLVDWGNDKDSIYRVFQTPGTRVRFIKDDLVAVTKPPEYATVTYCIPKSTKPIIMNESSTCTGVIHVAVELEEGERCVIPAKGAPLLDKPGTTIKLEEMNEYEFRVTVDIPQ